MRCIAYCTAAAYNLKNFALNCDQESIKYKLYDKQVIHLPNFMEKGDVFIFSYGCIVFWDYTRKHEHQIINKLKEWATGSTQETESDEFTVLVHSKKDKDAPTIEHDTIILSGHRVLDKLSISFGLAQSVKLNVFEDILAKTIAETERLPESLAKNGKISLSRREISKKMGRLFLVRNSINLHTDMLDTPDFFWDHSGHEPLYKLVLKNLDVPLRVDVLNRRLDMIQELFSMLGAELNHQHSSLLEWIIIILISVEIGLFMVKETHLFGL